MAEIRRSDILLAFTIAVVLAFCYVLRHALVLIYVSIIFAVIFSPVVSRISRVRIGRWSPGKGGSVLILVGGVFAGLTLFLVLAVPPIANDARGMSKELPQRLGEMQQNIAQWPLGKYLASKTNLSSLEKYAGDLLQSVFTFFQGFAGGVTALITLVLLTSYFILDGDRAFGWAMSLVPFEKRERLQTTLVRGGRRIQKWLGGQLLLMLILGSASAVVFGLLGVRYFYALAVFAGIANFVPILGPIATVIVAGLIAALDSWTKLLGVIVFYAVYQQVENSYLTPRIMKFTVHLPAVSVIAALLIGSELVGLLGAIVAVPTAALVSTMISEYLVEPDRKRATEMREVRRAS